MQGTIHRSPVRIDRGAGGFGGSGADRIGRRTIHGDVQRLPSGARNGKNRNESGAVSASAHLVQRFGSFCLGAIMDHPAWNQDDRHAGAGKNARGSSYKGYGGGLPDTVKQMEKGWGGKEG